MTATNDVPHRFDTRLPELKGTIFVVTYGRSGSTLLQTVLQSIPGAYILGENNNVILHLWRAYAAMRGAKKIWGPRGGEISHHPWYGTQNYRPHDFSMRMADAFMFNVLCPPRDARWVGFKEIRYREFGDGFENALNFMARTFKNPYFVFNSRSADAVSKSSWWRSRDPEAVKDMVNTMDERFKQYANKNPANTFINNYDNLVQNPESIRPLFDMLGEELCVEAVDRTLQHTLKH